VGATSAASTADCACAAAGGVLIYQGGRYSDDRDPRQRTGLVPEISGRAEEIEQARDVPLDLVEKLRAAGVFSRYCTTLTWRSGTVADRSVTVIEGSHGPTVPLGGLICGGDPEAPRPLLCLSCHGTLRQIYADGPKGLIPLGHIYARRPVPCATEMGKRDGPVGFASGCTHAGLHLPPIVR